MRPGVDIVSRAQPLPRSAPTSTGPWFVAGVTAIGPVGPTLIRSLTQYETTYGARSGGAVLYDAADTFFREGGSQLWVSAVPTAPTLLAREIDTGEEVESEKGSKSKTEVAPEPTATAPANPSAALDLFTKQLGPGQVSIPGDRTAITHQAVLTHAANNNRIALLDAPDGTAASMVTFGLAAQAYSNARYGSLWGPSALIPGVAGGTMRQVGFSAIVAGILARNDVGGNPNIAAAGDKGVSLYALDLLRTYLGSEYESLNAAGVDMARNVYGQIEAYGFRTLVPPTTQPDWLSLGNARLNMAIVAEAGRIGEHYVFTQLDGRRLKISQFGGELAAMLLGFWTSGALYGASAPEAFAVDVGPNVNTEASIAAGELHAVLSVKMSPFAEWVQIEIVKVATTDVLAVAA